MAYGKSNLFLLVKGHHYPLPLPLFVHAVGSGGFCVSGYSVGNVSSVSSMKTAASVSLLPSQILYVVICTAIIRYGISVDSAPSLAQHSWTFTRIPVGWGSVYRCVGFRPLQYHFPISVVLPSEDNPRVSALVHNVREQQALPALVRSKCSMHWCMP